MREAKSSPVRPILTRSRHRLVHQQVYDFCHCPWPRPLKYSSAKNSSASVNCVDPQRTMERPSSAWTPVSTPLQRSGSFRVTGPRRRLFLLNVFKLVMRDAADYLQGPPLRVIETDLVTCPFTRETVSSESCNARTLSEATPNRSKKSSRATALCGSGSGLQIPLHAFKLRRPI